MTARERPLCDCPSPAAATPRNMPPARTRPTSRCWPAWRERPPRGLRLPVLPGEAGLPAEGDDPAGQELPGPLELVGVWAPEAHDGRS